MRDDLIKPIQPIFGLTNDKHNINYKAPGEPNKAPADDNVTKSFNDIFEGLKKANFEHERGKK